MQGVARAHGAGGEAGMDGCSVELVRHILHSYLSYYTTVRFALSRAGSA